ncbi:MAG: D-alanyl-D-alanine endopeptidase [gamma proteobacterium symbiont of Lucinoma myriamae]|nr:D-alanyl-D-alanine endopeptidase [gamma proteobacterium symbiont of Lucinoma myriamae]MCU7818514.1 D-alanyl-D-alanine endopeptidase [gamma proteobacterium symbiont of Lucinoma myriamae]MCU7832931.1 D-alanyl-D-alanine endopeptidase [gamma proteobacterium symbiont of Lucinoma myriamae]
MKKIIFNILCFTFLLFLSYAGFAQTSAAKESVNLASVSAIAVDSKTGSVLFTKNSDIVMPIASITKLMTAIVILDAKLSLKEKIRFAKEDKESINNYFSRVRVESELSRGDTLRIALMSSENLAASSLARNYPGGSIAFVKAMNAKAKALGMKHTHFVNSTGLSEKNVSTASDLAKMVAAAAKYPLIKKYSTTQTFTARFKRPRYVLGYTNTNVLVRAGKKDVKLSKTGYLDEAGRCLTMLRRIGNKDVVLVMLDSFGKRSPIGDANRIKKWLETGKQGRVAKSALNYERMKLAQYSK